MDYRAGAEVTLDRANRQSVKSDQVSRAIARPASTAVSLGGHALDDARRSARRLHTAKEALEASCCDRGESFGALFHSI